LPGANWVIYPRIAGAAEPQPRRWDWDTERTESQTEITEQCTGLRELFLSSVSSVPKFAKS